MKTKITILSVLLLLTLAAVFGPLAGAAASPGRYDVDDGYTVGLLHFDDDLYGFYDESGLVWDSVGDPAIDPALYKFPAGSLDLDGDDCLYTASDLDYQFGAGDWTIDFQIYLPETPAAYQYLYWYGNQSDATDATYILVNTDRTVEAGIYEGSNLDNVTTTQTIPLTTWTHVAIVRNGTELDAFIGGVGIYGYTDKTIGVPSDSPLAEIGAHFSGAYIDDFFVGHLDEFRISKGIARWTTDFTPPSAEYEPAIVDTDTPTETATGTLNTPTDTLVPSATYTPNYDVLYLGTGTPIAIIEHSVTWGDLGLVTVNALLCMVLLLVALIGGALWLVTQRKK